MFGFLKKRPVGASGMPVQYIHGNAQLVVEPRLPALNAGITAQYAVAARAGTPVAHTQQTMSQLQQTHGVRTQFGNRGYVKDVTSTGIEYYSRPFVDNGGEAYLWSPKLLDKNGTPYRQIMANRRMIATGSRSSF